MGGIDPGMILEALRNGIWPDPARTSGTPPMYELEGLRRLVVTGEMSLEDYERCVEILLERPRLREISREINTPTASRLFAAALSGLAGARRDPTPPGYGVSPSREPAARGYPTESREARVLQDRFPLLGADGFRVVFEYADTRRPRAVGIASDLPVGVGGGSGTNHLLWCDATPPVSEIECPFALGEVTVYNAYIAPGIPAGLANGAMAATETPSGRSYRCNTEYPCDEPHDLVFKVERLYYQASKNMAIGR